MNLMKSTGSTHRRPQLSLWHRRPNTSEPVLKRIQAITRELEALQAEMHIELAEPDHGRTTRLFEDSAAIEAVNLFKAELDQLRRILWFYTGAAESKHGAAAEQEQQ